MLAKKLTHGSSCSLRRGNQRSALSTGKLALLGCIEADQLGRIFDPFYTTQDVGQGMGLGLTVAADLVRAHDGHIDDESVKGSGSTFRILIPAAGAAGGQP